MKYKNYIVKIDPYPFSLPDSSIWDILLTKALEVDEYMAGILHWYRATGTILVCNEKFGFLIKPLILGVDGCKWGWESMDEWKNEKQYLIPYAEKVTEMLIGLRKEIEKC